MKTAIKQPFYLLWQNYLNIIFLSLAIPLSAMVCPVFGQAGSLDASFDGDGIVTTPIGNVWEGAYPVLLQPDGKIIAAGYSNSGTQSSLLVDFAVARYHPDGSLDTTFSGDGKVITDFGSIGDYATGALLQPDGKIVVCGRTYINVNSNRGSAIARYNPDGSLDNTFDGDGKVTYDVFSNFDDVILDCAIQPDGKIVVAGYGYSGSDNVFIVLRFNPSGSLDTAFGTGGLSTFVFGSSTVRCIDVVVLSGGKILTLGYVDNITNDFALVQLNSNGQLDNTFGTGGWVTTDLAGADDYGEAIAVQPDGKIIAAGYTGNILTVTQFAMVRYLPSGAIDASFGVNGRVTTAFGGVSDQAYAIALQPDSKILLVGRANNGTNDFGIARYNNNGMLDSTFDSDGKVTVAIGSNHEEAFGVALQPDGKIVVGGRAEISDDDFALIRLRGDVITSSGIDAVSKPADGVYLFPNPACDKLTLDNIKPAAETAVRIYDSSGRLVYEALLTGKMQHQLNIGTLEPDAYVCEITDESRRQTLLFSKIK